MDVRVILIILLLIAPFASARVLYVQDITSHGAGYAEFGEDVIATIPSNVSIAGNPVGGGVIAWSNDSAILYTGSRTVNVDGSAISVGFVHNTTRYWYMETDAGVEVYDSDGVPVAVYGSNSLLVQEGEILEVLVSDTRVFYVNSSGSVRKSYDLPWNPEWLLPVYGGVVAGSQGRALYHNGTVHYLPVDDVDEVIPTPFRTEGVPVFIAVTHLREEGVSEYLFRFVTPREVLGTLKTFTPPVGYAFGENGTVVIADRTHLYVFRNICEPFMRVRHSFSFIATWNFTSGTLVAVEGDALISLSIWPEEVIAWGTDVDGDGVLRDSDLDDDGDGMPDAWEERHGLDTWTNDSHMDYDGDKLTNYAEYLFGTDPMAADTDGDGLDDYMEFILGTNGTDPDTDGDGLSDGEEVRAGTDPLNPPQVGSEVYAVSMEGPAFILALMISLLSLAFAMWKKYK